MSVSMTKADGVTVFTVTSDPQSRWPPLCQILKSLCYSPVCCSVSEPLRRIQRSSQSVLGTLHIMVGLFNIGLGAILVCSHIGLWGHMNSNTFPFWMGGLFILFGIVCILSEKYPSPCLIILSVFLNLAGVCFAIAAIVLYSINLGNIFAWWICRQDHDWYGTTSSPSREKEILQEKCLEGKAILLMLVRSIHIVLIVLSVLELCVALSSAVMGIKALTGSEKRENQVELREPLPPVTPLIYPFMVEHIHCI